MVKGGVRSLPLKFKHVHIQSEIRMSKFWNVNFWRSIPPSVVCSVCIVQARTVLDWKKEEGSPDCNLDQHQTKVHFEFVDNILLEMFRTKPEIRMDAYVC